MAMPPARRSGQNLAVVDPSREFEDIYDRMGQLMNIAFGDLGMARLADVPWSPLADVSETDDAYLVHVELPGIRKDQIDVQLQDRQLIVSGKIKETENGRRHRSSRRAGRFEYRTYLPGDVKADQVSAKLSDGVLTVTVPKSEAAKPRRIEVQTSDAKN
ncbi:MAG TPA: Hsp20/alpha crystallin family protein [Streptosporangiaceae bacterium]|jgi:HSP20 family protein|nr:Hsp20/alpha crystallin family protein [Streptosporangiaceae bacterium]